MISINNLSFYYGARPIYKDANLHIKPKDRIGLIGANGTGKTTLLKLIYGTLVADGGEISKSTDVTIGFLNQDLLSYESNEPILHVAMQGFGRVVELQAEIDKLLHELEADYQDEMVEKLAKLQEQFEALDGYSAQSRAEEILEGLGFATASLMRPLKEFSGGWRMRVMLAKLLLQKPSLLMLDEPTNHLDLPSILWIENYLQNYEGAVVIVSHDREFLDRAVNKIVEVSGAKLNEYSGNYTFYLEEKEMRAQIQNNAFKNQQQKLRQTERFIERFKAKASKARQVKSKEKMLDKLDLIEEVSDDISDLHFRFTFKQQPGRIIVSIKDADKAYGDNEILKASSFEIERGDKIALIGANGKGKSTVLRMVSGKETFNGEIIHGHNVITAFYAQHQLESLKVDNEILQELKEVGSNKLDTELRQILGCFLFEGEEVFKKIKVLSGGEKSRVALAKTLISEANFLVLDEPTNHLDIMSVNILIQALQQYKGTFLVVSHDRHFVSNIANKIWYIEDKQVKQYIGTYDEYVYWQEEIKQKSGMSTTETAKMMKEVPKQAPPKDDNAQKEQQKKLKKAKQDLDAIETKISETERQAKQLEAELALPSVYGNAYMLAETNDKYNKVQATLAVLQKEWETIAEQMEVLENA